MGKGKWRLRQTLPKEEEEFFYRRKVAFNPLSGWATQLRAGARFLPSATSQPPWTEANWLFVQSSASGAKAAQGFSSRRVASSDWWPIWATLHHGAEHSGLS